VNTFEDPILDSATTPIPPANDHQDEQPFAHINRVLALFLAMCTWLASIILLFLPQLIALPYILSHYRGQQPRIEEFLADKTLIVILIAGLLPAHLITLAIAWAVVTRFGKIPVKAAMQWGWGHRMGVVKSAVLGVLLFGAAWLIVLAFGGKETELERIINSSRAAALLIALLAVATAPLVEEIIYRGILFPAWQRLTGSVGAVIIVTLMFAIPHVPQYWPNLGVIASIMMLSAVLTIVRARTSRLVPCYIIHLVFNGIQALLILAEPYLRAISNHPEPKAAPAILHSLAMFL
jgi:membrane protease YdiL (CAAX protease family)